MSPLETAQGIRQPPSQPSKRARATGYLTFSSLALTGNCSKHKEKAGQDAASLRLHPGSRREPLRVPHTTPALLREEGGTAYDSCSPRLLCIIGLCRVSPRNTLWKCYVFSRMCNFGLQDSVLPVWFHREQTMGTKSPVTCPEEINLSCTDHISWKVSELDQL